MNYIPVNGNRLNINGAKRNPIKRTSNTKRVPLNTRLLFAIAICVLCMELTYAFVIHTQKIYATETGYISVVAGNIYEYEGK